MTEPYLFEKAIGQQMGDLCRLAVGDAKVTQTGEIVTLEDMPGRGTMGVSVDVPYTSGGVQSVNVERCGKNLLDFAKIDPYAYNANGTPNANYGTKSTTELLAKQGLYTGSIYWKGYSIKKPSTPVSVSSDVILIKTTGLKSGNVYFGFRSNVKEIKIEFGALTHIVSNNLSPNAENLNQLQAQAAGNAGAYTNLNCTFTNIQIELGSTATAYEPYNGDTYTITLPADFCGGSINLESGTVTSRYAADGTDLPEPVVTEIDPISIPILAGVNNVWADVGTVTVSYYAADAEAFRPALWYPTIYRGLTSARYLIKRAGGSIASFDDAVAAPLVGLRVALPYDAEGYQSVSVTRTNYTELPETLAINAKQDGSGAPSPENIRPIHPGLSFERDDGTTLDVYGGTLNVIETNITEQVKFAKPKASGKLGTWDESTNSGAFFFTDGISPLAKSNDGVITNKLPLDNNVSVSTNYNSLVWYANGIIRWIELGKMTLSATEYNNYLELNPLEVVYSTPNPTKTILSSSELSRALAALGYISDTYTIPLPTTIYGGYLDAVTGQLVATHDENGNLLTNQKLYFLDPVNINALAGVNNVWSDAGDVAVSYRVEQ